MIPDIGIPHDIDYHLRRARALRAQYVAQCLERGAAAFAGAVKRATRAASSRPRFAGRGAAGPQLAQGLARQTTPAD